ncbi:SusC/RagA family TonB-linked outer membrane protein [Membranihabitans maritimus]|uniref:SusC/RagA family TonB-linked outer membrane protein n=1 Tax=Membranihabitans maritimus TaxID=2904244 RepID=UPI001F4637C9|nr:TonB-dependent receptor [Membranihabitans maritimus]
MDHLNTRFKQFSLALIVFLLLFCGHMTAHASPTKSGEEITLLDAIQLLSKKYQVYFTYDRTLVSDVKVEYDKDALTSVDTELSILLKNTNLDFQIFENQFIIIYKEDAEGIKSLRKMKNMMESILAEKDAQKERRKVIGRSLSPLTRQTIDLLNRSRIVASVSGTVVDEDNIPLIGVNVRIKDTGKGTATDFNGQFSFDDINENDVLVFSYIGYVTKEVPVNGRKDITVVLKSDAETLEEVIVVGYGVQKKVNVSGAVDYIDGKKLEDRPVANVMQGLQGISPGLNINYEGGAPGSKPNINIRGFTSINGGSPLVIIDGVSATYDDLLRINPNDIESYSVLKDAASAAIYGARAAFGVILITTKSGSAGKPTINYSNYVAWGKPTVLPEPVTDPYIFSRVKEISTDNTPWDYVNYTDEQYRWAKERSEDPSVEQVRLDPNDPTKWAYMGDNNWNDYFFNNNSLSYNHSLSFSGGVALENGKQIGYYLSGDLTNENGLNKLADDYYDRKGLRAKLNFDPVPWLELRNNASIYQTERVSPRASILDIYSQVPIDVAKNPDGTWANTEVGRLAAELVDGGSNLNTLFGFQDIVSATAKFLDNNLVITGRASFKKELWKYHYDTKKYQIGFGPDDIRTEGGNGSVSEENGNLDNTILDLFATYSKTLGDHSIKVLGGVNQENYVYSTVGAYRDILISSSLPYISLTSGEPSIEADYESYATRSAFGRINYGFKDRYLFEVNGRYDGSSRFPEDGRWGFFPSVSAAWVLSDESFFKNAFANREPFIKLRASYGDLGNQEVGDFDYIQTLGAGNSPYIIDGRQPTVITGGAPSLNIDPTNYTWERVSTLNFGADIGFWEGKLQGTFDIFNRQTLGMLVAGQELPGVLGTSVPSQNNADLETKGWEASLQFRNELSIGSKPLDYSVKVIVSDARSWITKYENDLNLLSDDYREGEEVGQIWGLESDGLFMTEEEIAALDESAIIPWGALSIVPGWPKYIDQDGNGKIERGQTADEPKDLKVIGNSSSRYRVGANLEATWNGFDLAVFLQGVLRRDYYPRHYLYWGTYQQPYANIYPWNLDFYRGSDDSESLREQHSQSYIDAGLADANTDSYFPVLQSWLADANYGSGLDIPQTGHLLNGAYLRVKNLTFGYTLPMDLTEKFKVSRLRVFFTGENLYAFSKIKKYIDPEAVENYRAWVYPYQRKVSIGLNLNF